MTSAAAGLASSALEQERLVLEDFLPFRLALSAQAVSHLIATTCETRFGLSIPAWRVLCLIAQYDRLFSAELASRAVLGQAEVARACADLVSRGLAIGEVGGGVIEITSTGRSAHTALAHLALAAEAALVSSLSPREVRDLKTLLGRVQSAAARLSAGANATAT